jgi:hypothetical protein
MGSSTPLSRRRREQPVRRSRAQRVAIAAEYWRKGESAEFVAGVLHTSVADVESIFAHVEVTERQASGDDRPPAQAPQHGSHAA